MAYEEVLYRWTSADWAGAAEAKKAKDAGTQPPPKILVTPYGLSPFQFYTDGAEGGQVVIKLRVYLASDTGDKKPLAAWDIPAGTEVMIPLELAKFGEPWYRDRFYKKEQAWIPRPASATGATLLDLCQALYATGQPQFDVYHYFSDTKPEKGARVNKTDQDVALDTPVRERVLSKLVGHWKNTQYHYEQARRGYPVNGNLPATLKSEAGADVTLEVVMTEPPPPAVAKPVAPQGAAGGEGSGAVVAVDMRPAGGSLPPPPFDKLPEPLKVTLVQSYRDRQGIVPGAEKALGDSFEKGANVWEALNKSMSWQDINSMVRVYQRMEAVDKTGALWRDHILYVVRAYTYGIYAVELVYKDRARLKSYLDEITHRNDLPKLANASGFFQCMHGGTVGWREVSDTDQLHISVADDTVSLDTTGGAEGAPAALPDVPVEAAVEDCHIDETSFTAGRDEEGNAVPAYGSGPKHFIQSQEKWIDIARPFAKLEAILSSPRDDAKRPKSADAAARLDAWASKRGAEAVSGERGHESALELLRTLEGDSSP